uniref:Sushi, von Willebrand factor type A, EGF and pentraxin domain-containing protein 1 n=1 Tax=Strigamia maritima TaxID=126957 RepID=T1IZH3_STRMM
KCPPGTYYEANTLTCTLCPLNTYQDIESSSECKSCPVLHYTSQEGAENENQCKAACEIGEYSQTGLQQCIACPIGTYQNETRQVSCRMCSEDKTTWSVGAYSEHQCTTPCSPGHYSPTGFEPCMPCARGFFQSSEQSTECIKCEGSQMTLAVGTSDVTQCLEINPCKPNPCFNHADCLNDNGKVKCQCSSGYFGDRCDIEIDHCDIKLSCLNGGTCMSNNESYTCECPHGYSGFYCEKKTRNCLEGTCLNGGTCIDNGNSHHCECLDGFSGNNCEQNFDDCFPGACQNGGTCFDSGKPQSANKFYCCCPKGYYGPLCDKPIECDSIHCANGGTCLHDKCLCKPGFIGELCEKKINYCLLRPCHNHGTCINNQVNFLCECAPGFKGDLCEHRVPIDYDMVFVSQNTSIYTIVNTTKDLYALTISFWMKVESSDTEHFGTPISYSYLSPIDKHTELTGLSFYNSEELIVYLHGMELRTLTRRTSDGIWHHYLMTWGSFDGTWRLYKDGEQVADGSGVGVGIPLWRGYMVIGQDQNTLGGGFRQIDSFKGIISQVNLWDFAMEVEEVKQLYRSCGYIGNVIGWPDFQTTLPDGTFVTSSPSDICSGLDKCGQNVKECHCHNNNILNSTLCENRLETCISNSCQHNQLCRTLNNVSFCDCHGYTGKFCHYDINECLYGNGGCTHECINTHGSYSCNCPKGFTLDTDGHTCTSLRQCLHKGLLYAEKEEWTDGCEKCNCIKGKVKCHFKKCSQIDCL